MSKVVQACLVVVLVLAAYTAGRWHVWRSDRSSAVADASHSKILYYHCPMHPQYRSDRPADAPCCGMRLEPVYEEGAGTPSAALPPGVFHVSPEKQQRIGVVFEPAEITGAPQVIRAAGKVAYDQRETVLIADIFEYESTLIRLGQRAWVRRPYPPRREFWATVDYFYPRLDPSSRTLKVRLNAGDVITTQRCR